MKFAICIWTLLGVLLVLVQLNCHFTGAIAVPQPRDSEIKSNSIDEKTDDHDEKVTSELDNATDGDDDDEDNDQGLSKPLASSSTIEKTKLLKVCVFLSPGHVSTRNGPFVSYECSARICSDADDEGAPIDEESYKFRNPLFDWNSQFSHMLLSNGTCDSTALNCWHKIDINVESLTGAMEEDGIEQIEIKCAVADYVNSYEIFNFVSGEATSVLRHFKGNRAHEPCNTTDDCGENLICAQNDDNSVLAEDIATGFCECPSEKLISVASQGDLTTSAMRSFILAEDPHYLEQLCVPVRSFNESCLYDSQCRAIDWNLFCKQTVRSSDQVPSSEMVCDCLGGLRWGSVDGLTMKCLDAAGSSDANQGVGELATVDGSDNATLQTLSTEDQESTSSGSRVYIWWIFPPSQSTDSQLESSRSSHGLYYYGSRYLTLTSFAYFLAAFAVMLPVILIVVALILFCHRKLMQSRQYQPRRASFADSIYSDVVPSTPSEKTTKSVTFGFGSITPPSSPNGKEKKTFAKFSLSKKSEDKLDLVDNDQLAEHKSYP